MNNNYEATTPITPNQYVPPLDIKEKTVSALNELIAICKDGEAGFKDSSEGVTRADLKTLFQEISTQRGEFADGLQLLVNGLGGEPTNEGHFSATVQRTWLNVRKAIAGKDDAVILNECERSEDQAKAAYRESLKHDLPDFVRETVQNQYFSVLNAHDRIRDLRDAANAARSNPAQTGVL